MNFNNGINALSAPLIPQQQVVIPPINIPQGFQSQQKVVYKQLTAKGKEIAKNMDIGPDTKVAIFDEELEGIFYFKETDENNNTITFDTYEYVKKEEPPPPRYLTVDEFKEAMAEFAKTLKEDLNNGQYIRTQTNKPAYSNARSSSSSTGSDNSK